MAIKDPADVAPVAPKNAPSNDDGGPGPVPGNDAPGTDVPGTDAPTGSDMPGPAAGTGDDGAPPKAADVLKVLTFLMEKVGEKVAEENGEGGNTDGAPGPSDGADAGTVDPTGGDPADPLAPTLFLKNSL